MLVFATLRTVPQWCLIRPSLKTLDNDTIRALSIQRKTNEDTFDFLPFCVHTCAETIPKPIEEVYNN